MWHCFRALAVVVFVSSVAVGDVLNPGTQSWAAAAKTGRADMLILGDSVVWVNGDGWDAGFTAAAARNVGLAGTGLIANSFYSGEGEGYAVGNIGSGWNTDGTSVPSAYQGYQWDDPAATAGVTPASGFGYFVGNSTLNPSSAFDWHVYSASTSGGQIGAYRRIDYAPYTTIATDPTVHTAPGFQSTTFHLDGNSSAGPQDVLFTDTANTSILYSRLTVPGASGATVSSWSYGGQSTLSLLQDKWNQLSQPGRAALLNSLVDGGSGKLNVVITEGFNDQNETRPSVDGLTPGNSPQAFSDNLSALMSAIRNEWVADGHGAANLSFTLVGMYQIGGDNTLLREYAAAEQALAGADPQVSFVDLYSKAPDFNTAYADGYFLPGDTIHLSRAGSLAYGQLAFDALTVPEPAAAGMLAAAGLLFMRRRRS